MALPVAACSTASEKAGSEADAVPSDTEMMMFENVATSVSAGVPDSRPVDVLNVAQAGRFWMLNVSVLPSGSWRSAGTNTPSRTLIDSSGVPEMVGARLAGADDLDRERGQRRGRGAVGHGNRDATPTCRRSPSSACPYRRPVVALNDAQLGWFWIE